MTGKEVLGFPFTFAVWVMMELLRRSTVGAHLVGGAWVVKKDEKHFAPEMSMYLVVDEGTKGATRLSECGRCTDVAEKCGDDDNLLKEFRGEREKRSPEI